MPEGKKKKKVAIAAPTEPPLSLQAPTQGQEQERADYASPLLSVNSGASDSPVASVKAKKTIQFTARLASLEGVKQGSAVYFSGKN